VDAAELMDRPSLNAAGDSLPEVTEITSNSTSPALSIFNIYIQLAIHVIVL